MHITLYLFNGKIKITDIVGIYEEGEEYAVNCCLL